MNKSSPSISRKSSSSDLIGDERLSTGALNSLFNLFTDQYKDQESNIYYYKQRYYDPVLSRFLSADPLYAEEMDKRGTDSQELNLYAYVKNNPLNRVDPEGLKSEIYTMTSNFPHSTIRVDNPKSSTGSTYVSFGPKDTSNIGFVKMLLGPVEGRLTIVNSLGDTKLSGGISISDSKAGDAAILERAAVFKESVNSGDIKYTPTGNFLDSVLASWKACNCIDAAFDIGLGGSSFENMVESGNSNDSAASSPSTPTSEIPNQTIGF